MPPEAVTTDGPALRGSPALTPGRRRRKPRRVTAGAAVPVALGILAAGFAYESLQGKSAMTVVVVARRALDAGQPVDSADTRLVSVHSTDRALLHDLARPSELNGGWVASVPVPAGEPLTASELSRPTAGPPLGEMSIAVPVQQAVGGRLAPGDLVDVITSNGQGGAYYVAQGLRVVAVAPASPSGALLGTSTSYYVVVAVGKEAALKVAAAVGAQGSGGNGLELVRSSGEHSTSYTSFEGPSTGASGTSTSASTSTLVKA